MLFIAIFAMFFALMSSFVSRNSESTSLIRSEDMEKTRDYFTKFAKVINEDITPRYYQANPDGYANVDTYVTNRPELAQLTISSNGDVFADPWGHPFKGKWKTLPTSLAPGVSVPVTGFLIWSYGPDGVQDAATTIPGTLNAVSDVYLAKAGGDDIVTAFDNSSAQRKLFTEMQTTIGRIAAASIRNLEGRVNARQQILLSQYKQVVAAGGNPPVEMIDLTTDSVSCYNPITNKTETKEDWADREHFVILDNVNDCLKVGADKDCDKLINTPVKNAIVMTSQRYPTAPMASLASMTITLTDNASGMPWSVNYNVLVDISTTAVK